MQLWEYKVLDEASAGGKLSSVEIQQVLNINGEEGWELVDTISKGEVLFIFKRPMPAKMFLFKLPMPIKKGK
jgi:hypothetical protein